MCPPSNVIGSPDQLVRSHRDPAARPPARAGAPQHRLRARDGLSRAPGGLGGGQPLPGSDQVLQHPPDRAHERLGVRPDRARLHARLRHPAADQLRERRRVRARRPRREHDDPDRLRHLHRRLRGSDRPRHRGDARGRDGLLGEPQRRHRARRLSPAPQRAAARAAHHRGRHVLHPPEHRPRSSGA